MSSNTGMHLVGGRQEAGTGSEFGSFDPRTGDPSPRRFREAGPDQVDRAVEAAAAWVSRKGYGTVQERIALLDGIADALDAAESEIVSVADRESGLGENRLSGELGRTTGQLRAFSAFLRTGDHEDRVEDLVFDGVKLVRSVVPIGVVAVFEASNFPLAFATMGGDTASALAAGCPVVIKAHPDHPETSELVGNLAAEVVSSMDLDGILSVLHGPSIELGSTIVESPAVAAVGFTGSVPGGRALMDLAARRPVPIPVYAEMGSVNPLVVTPAAAESRAEEIAEGYVGSLLLGAGQFCTNPGLLFVPDGDAGERLIEKVGDRVRSSGDHVLLDQRIAARYEEGCRTLTSRGEVLAESLADGPGYRVRAVLVEMKPPLEDIEEVFGPAGVVVRYSSSEELIRLLEGVPGALAAAIHAEEDEPESADLIDVLAMRVGRIVWNGYPTGVAVSPAMMHGGPYPSASDPLHTSVGLAAMRRFQRPIAFQGVPDAYTSI